MKKNFAFVIALLVFFIISYVSFTVMQSKKNMPTGESIVQDDFSKRITVNQAGCNIALQLPDGYLISSVPSTNECFLTITTPSNDSPTITISTVKQENVDTVASLTAWVNEKITKELRAEQTETPKNGQIGNSVQINTKNTTYPGIETYIFHGKTIYTVTMTARKTASTFTEEEQRLYTTLLKSILLN